MQKASELNINVFTYKWLEAVWEKNIKDFVPANDTIFLKHKCPVFLNLTITSINLSKQDEDKVMRLVNENGGVSELCIIL